MERRTARLHALVSALADRPLLTGAHGETILRLGDGALPRLVAWTHEDKAAKGLRKLGAEAAPQPPIPFTVGEMIADAPALLLAVAAGDGQSTVAASLAWAMAAAQLSPSRPWPGPDPVTRNERGDALPEAWPAGRRLPVPVLITARADATLDRLLAEAGGLPCDEPILLIVDDLDRAGAVTLLRDLRALQDRTPGLGLLALAEAGEAAAWRLPEGWTRLALLPPLAAQRRDYVRAHPALHHRLSPAALAPDAANASLFALALAAPGDDPSALATGSRWLAGVAAGGGDADVLAEAAWARLTGAAEPAPGDPSRRIDQLLATRRLMGLPADAVARQFADHARALSAPVADLLAAVDDGRRRALGSSLLALPGEAGQRGALLAGTALAPSGSPSSDLAAALLAILDTGALSAAHREQAGRILARHGDPRDLEALADVPAGMLTMGAATPPNSAPVHRVAVGPFRIGIYPVTNGLYARFVAATGRPWLSPERNRPDRRSAPATDLTWRDARAYCAWLTERWRAEGRIGLDEIVRLATEPEWERAARGDQPDGGDQPVYPWGGPWDPTAVNGEETGFNDTCTVGLFPHGRSPWGCHDMAGQVWEWTSTLWGEDMATPRFTYPYADDDGREDADAGPAVRRVLRGGCFSSGAAKANCTYRGSLEPDGFWRGNGFRIVVASA